MTDLLGECRPHTLVLGFGNPLWGDDGAGIEAVHLLAQQPLPTQVRVEAAGLPGFGLAAHLQAQSVQEELQRLILVDAARMGQPPGAWRRFSPEQAALIANGSIVSLHQADLSSGLALAQALDILPQEVLFYGIEPACLDAGLELSPAVREALPQMVEEILIDLWNGREKNEQ